MSLQAAKASCSVRALMIYILLIEQKLFYFADMFHNARDFNISGGEFKIQYLLHDGDRDQSVRQ